MEAATGSDFKRIIDDVCAIFKDVTGMEAKPTREAQAIVHWARKGWMNNDFRIVIEHQVKDPKASKWFLENPEYFSLKGMLNEKRSDILEDMLQGLKFAQSLQDKRFEKSSGLTRLPMMLMRCGKKISMGDKAAYDIHMKECFENKGACFL